ncbi:hypothetical protein GQ43DRAFT_476475 [Delitschia confertaspora ATCC 74209]|uniref:Uncharacterized protein n=1 Tax=Delitschia confertaspora ATCC 74209 TaxID=1513339 RepID=A0A9P4JBJ4_9PLEO|nr:hypothetical protein GQ43DRAFT_476475 [Delitschia confertaspora ATCC 74209]
MVKLNYTKRRSEGIKLGEIIAKDLRKKIAPFISKSEDKRSTTPLELILPGRKLQDAGLREFVTDLTVGLTSSTRKPCFRLEEFNLANNELTVDALPLIASIVRASSSDLRNLSLSANVIKLNSLKDIEQWETFLNAFRNCKALRILDFTGNDFSNPQALETFTRVYASHPIVDPTEFGIPDEVPVTPIRESKISNRKASVSPPSSRATVPDVDMNGGYTFSRRCGLRSVPYMVFSNCSLTDAGALSLSYVLAHHYYPQLMCSQKPVSTATQLDEPTYGTYYWGLTYLPNEHLSENGLKLLSMAEDVRRELNSSFTEGEDLANSGIEIMRVDSKQNTPNKAYAYAMQNKRRPSIWSTNPSASHEDAEYTQAAADLDSLRRKVQRTLLDTNQTFEIWKAAFKLLLISRLLLVRPPKPKPDPEPHMLENPNYRSTIFSHFARNLFSCAQKVYWIPINLTLADDVNKLGPALPWVCGGQVITEETDLDVARLSTNEKAWALRPKLGKRTLKLLDSAYSEPENLGSLPRNIWKKIFTEALDIEGKLSGSQLDRIVEWSMARQTMVQEMELSGKARAVQMITMLEKMGAVSYDLPM